MSKIESQRLFAINQWINSNDLLADCGCDHGYTLLYALEKGVKRVQAIDINPLPLQRTVELLDSEGYHTSYVASLADGLSIIEDWVNTITICGMGFYTIRDILMAYKGSFAKFHSIIFDCHKDVEKLRTLLQSLHLMIVDEVVVYENHKYYELIKTKYTEEEVKYSNNEILFGPILLKRRDEEFINMWKERMNKLKNIIKKIETNSVSIQVTNYKKEILMIEEMLKNDCTRHNELSK